MNDDPFEWTIELSKELHRLGEIRAESIRKRRIDAQNRPYTKDLKSRAMKRHWEQKRIAEAKERDEREYVASLGRWDGCCTCHLGHAPCSWCTNINYCEKCDIPVHADSCPSCGKEFE